MNYLLSFVYQKVLIQTFHTSFFTQRKNTDSKGDFVLKNQFETFVFKISGYSKIYLTQIWYNEFNK